MLLTLVDKPKAFAAGTSLYGVSDVARLAADTHKFESRYTDGLLGGTPEEIPDVYKARSPVTHADNIEAPLLVSHDLFVIGILQQTYSSRFSRVPLMLSFLPNKQKQWSK